MKTENGKMGRALLLALFMLPGLAGAACTQTNMAGTWHTLGGDDTSYDKCKIAVSSTGSIIPSRSVCRYRDESGLSGNVTFSGGTIRVSSACVVNGNMTMCMRGVCFRAIIEFGQLSTDKNILTMAGYAQVDPSLVFTYAGVKQ